jgi:hypothetical protein
VVAPPSKSSLESNCAGMPVAVSPRVHLVRFALRFSPRAMTWRLRSTMGRAATGRAEPQARGARPNAVLLLQSIFISAVLRAGPSR